jgi:transposase
VAAEPADHALGRSRGGFGTKLHLVVDGHGIPLSATLTAGQRHESQQVAAVLGRIRLPHAAGGRPRTRPSVLTGDKGYSYAPVRRYLRRRGIRPVIPTRSNQRPNPQFDRATYRRRSIVECVVGWLKESRRLATRYEKLAVNFLAMVKLAMLQRCLRVLYSSNRA